MISFAFIGFRKNVLTSIFHDMNCRVVLCSFSLMLDALFLCGAGGLRLGEFSSVAFKRTRLNGVSNECEIPILFMTERFAYKYFYPRHTANENLCQYIFLQHDYL